MKDYHELSTKHFRNNNGHHVCVSFVMSWHATPASGMCNISLFMCASYAHGRRELVFGTSYQSVLYSCKLFFSLLPVYYKKVSVDIKLNVCCVSVIIFVCGTWRRTKTFFSGNGEIRGFQYPWSHTQISRINQSINNTRRESRKVPKPVVTITAIKR